MSWSGFKKNACDVGRATTQVMMKTGHVEKTADREYEVEERRYRTLEASSLRLQKEAKGYLDSLRAMTASQMRIAETIDAFYGESGAKDGVSRSYKQAVEDLDAETIKALDGPYRCVPSDLVSNWITDKSTGLVDIEEASRIEWELNIGGKLRKQRKQTRLSEEDKLECSKLIEHIYRQTVLEPINRFCAYFPDINECIKKRNHKMLDYDAMRSKVKRLVEKPDKDPAKLPRTEKETEMVSTPQSVRKSMLLLDDASLDFTMPSPPKILDSPRRRARERVGIPTVEPEDFNNRQAALLQRSESSTSSDRGEKTPTREMERNAQETFGSGALTRSSSVMSNFCKSPRLGAGPEEAIFQRSTSASSPRPLSQRFSGFSFRDSPTEALLQRRGSKRDSEPPPTMRSIWADVSRTPSRSASRTRSSLVHRRVSELMEETPPIPPRSPRRTICGNPQAANTTVAASGLQLNTTPSYPSSYSPPASPMLPPPKHPRFSWNIPRSSLNPSELEDIMGPLKEQYIQDHANTLKQAKAAYEQLNDQLTSELPQLIDLRVPYLDPTFEALVKIQLRFCAEAYSRMAQVQQYLDASTRDQYASGDLDARVEDVLGQIRELSIAGTV